MRMRDSYKQRDHKLHRCLGNQLVDTVGLSMSCLFRSASRSVHSAPLSFYFPVHDVSWPPSAAKPSPTSRSVEPTTSKVLTCGVPSRNFPGSSTPLDSPRSGRPAYQDIRST